MSKEKYTAKDLVWAISQLPKDRYYKTLGKTGRKVIAIEDIILPEGPIIFRRWNPNKETREQVQMETIPKSMIWRYANAFNEGMVNADQLFNGSYNTRSVLETLAAHTPQFYVCYPGRIDESQYPPEYKTGTKYLYRSEDETHENGVATQSNLVNTDIAEIENKSIIYHDLELEFNSTLNTSDLNQLGIKRKHSQIQVALYQIGYTLGFETWIARNDYKINYDGKPLVDHPGVIKNLYDIRFLNGFDGAVRAAQYIDCIWFKDNKHIPAVIEVEHTTGITSGLSRMLNLYNKIPSISTHYIIAAPDEDRTHVLTEINKEQFAPLQAVYMSYSLIEELHYLCLHRKLKGIDKDFFLTFTEQ